MIQHEGYVQNIQHTHLSAALIFSAYNAHISQRNKCGAYNVLYYL